MDNSQRKHIETIWDLCCSFFNSLNQNRHFTIQNEFQTPVSRYWFVELTENNIFSLHF